MCACQHDGQCVKPEEGDTANTDSKFVYMGCACQGGYTGRFCDSDIDACEMNGQPCYAGVACIDLFLRQPIPVDINVDLVHQGTLEMELSVLVGSFNFSRDEV